MTPIAPLLLIAAIGFIGWGDFFSYGLYSPPGLRWVGVGCAALAAAAVVVGRHRRAHPAVVPLAVLTLLVWQGETLVRATTYYGAGHWLRDARFLSIALPTLGVAALVASRRSADWWWRALVVAFAAGCYATIRSSPKPAVDVWYLVQHASSCVVHVCNPYTMHTAASPGVKDGFNYLPATAVLLAPFRQLTGDIRYGEAAAIVVAALLLRRMGGSRGLRLAPLLLCVPGLFYAVEQAWTESLLVVLLVAATWWLGDEPAVRSRWLVSGLLLGVALATKQHVWLLLPVAAVTLGLRATATAVVTAVAVMLPWFVIDPHAFWHGTVTTFTASEPRVDSTSLWLHEPTAARVTVAIAVVLVAYVLACRSSWGMPPRFLLGSALVLAAFDLMNKQTFFNQWLLVTWLAIAALAVELREAQE